MYGSTQAHSAQAHSAQADRDRPHAAAEYPQDVRPLITRHRLRRRRRRRAATLLTGASIALGVAAMHTPSAAAHAPAAHPTVASAQLRPGTPQNPAPD
jgi:hypothetical protein